MTRSGVARPTIFATESPSIKAGPRAFSRSVFVTQRPTVFRADLAWRNRWFAGCRIPPGGSRRGARKAGQRVGGFEIDRDPLVAVIGCPGERGVDEGATPRPRSPGSVTVGPM
jgi:hypothetical protein